MNIDNETELSLDTRAGHFMQQGYYCSQASFAALQEQLSIECDADLFIKALRPFPGIALRLETCGAVSGCLIAIGLIHGSNDRDDKGQLSKCLELANDFCSRFVEELGSTRCGDIMEKQFGRSFDLHDSSQWEAFREAGSRVKCPEVVKTAVKIAYDILQQNPAPA
jgi:C_GCAxxG_C_C family probable redox protein